MDLAGLGHRVGRVTGVGKSRPARNASMHATVGSHPPAALLRLADRIANAAAFPAFGEHLHGPGDERMWERLRSLFKGPVAQ